MSYLKNLSVLLIKSLWRWEGVNALSIHPYAPLGSG